MMWPFSQFLSHSKNLTSLKIIELQHTTDENRSLIMDFAADVATTSKSLFTLHLERTRSSLAVGEKFWSTVANDDNLKSLTDLTIWGEEEWFADECEECIAPLLIVLARQPNITTLTMGEKYDDNSLSLSQA